ncbi:MAG: DUF3362 domain-containing protein [Chromatiales bacterium]|nr:DUF3362 domain-containing protein [Chromatiales bacterium]
MGRADLIGNGKHQLVPAYQPAGTGHTPEGARGKRRALRHPAHRPAEDAEGPKTEKAAKVAKAARPHAAKGRPHKHINPGSPTGAGKRRGAR